MAIFGAPVGLSNPGDAALRSALEMIELLERLEAVHFRHLDVEEHEGERLAAQRVDRGTPVLRGGDAMAEQLEAAREEQPVDLVVVDDQQPGRGTRA
jgi:hypothetical protein